ncbi:MAG TPA: hypothetical protein VJ725_01240 [Thermoanaerobaculia bacterium]|nr:hypothetical protein [Thermoanaerobaculia bacterium]
MRAGSSRFVVTLLVLAAWVAPGLPWLAAHAFLHHHHTEAEHEAVEEAAVQALLHGHAHPQEVPHHDHELVKVDPARHDSTPELRAAAPATLSDPLPAPRTASSWRSHPSDLPGADPPPRLHLLCVLLI